jgi:two-component system, sensor histidine kinase YesM
MDTLLKRIKHNGFFIFMFLITLTSIVVVSVAITWTTINMSEKFFIEKYSIMNSKVMAKIAGNFETFDNSIVNASNNLLQSIVVKGILTEKTTGAEKMNAYYNWDKKVEYISSILGTNQIGITIMGSDGTVYTDGNSNWPINEGMLKNSSIALNTLKDPDRLIYQYDYNFSVNPFNREDYMIASRGIMDPLSGKVFGSMYFSISKKQFKSLFTDNAGLGNTLFLVDRNGTIVSSNTDSLVGQQDKSLLSYAKEMENHPQKYMIKKFKGKDQIMLVEYIPFFDMYLFNMINKKEAIGDLINTKEIALIVVGIVFFALVIVFLASRRLTNSLTRLVKQIENASKNDFHYVSVAGTYETRQIGQAFNSMLEELHQYVDRLVLAQKNQRTAELEALQQQINPHFLYNTLASIKFMVLQGEKKDADATINALISLLQNTIGNVKETVTVRQELENLKNYVFINQKRYGERIKVDYFADPNCMEYSIPKLILQPFVENSFFHGFNHKPEGSIHILLWQEGNHMICEVVDNGDGMEVSTGGKLPDTKRKRKLFSGIGVKNVHERIQLIYGDPYGVAISSQLGEGTKVRITIPISPT